MKHLFTKDFGSRVLESCQRSKGSILGNGNRVVGKGSVNRVAAKVNKVVDTACPTGMQKVLQPQNVVFLYGRSFLLAAPLSEVKGKVDHGVYVMVMEDGAEGFGDVQTVSADIMEGHGKGLDIYSNHPTDRFFVL